MKLSIIMVTWSPNKERMELLKETMESLQSSIDIPYELIVIDNGPKEQTEYLKTLKIDKHIINDINKGIGYGWNQGYEASEGEFISLIDNDLLFAKDWAKDCIELLEKYPDKKLIATAIASVHHETSRCFLGRLGINYTWSRSATAGSVFRRTAVDDFGIWDLHPKPGAAWMPRLKEHGWKIISLTIPKIVHRGIIRSYDHVEMLKNGKWRKDWGIPDKGTGVESK